MKLSKTILVSFMPSLGMATVGLDWSFRSAPSSGLDDVTFGFNLVNAPHKSGFYFAQQFYFANIKNGSYAGLQPREDSNGQATLHAAFSSFEGGTTTGHANCHYGADGGQGVSCAVEFQADYSHTYEVVVQNEGGATWKGSVVDTATGKSFVIGEWTLPSGAGKMKASSVGFVEYYRWNDGKKNHVCSSLPRTEVTFKNPTSRTSGTSGGSISNIHEYGECVGTDGFSYSQSGSGWVVKVGS
ncbi:hypothetical protein QQS21_010198 [Conoideocrella luteorostrata]|uniref:Uncharacterized protein n=1 Tax=Conoideocrella luteorostrata TaxID=1105319 RepID=A0AAJ0FPM3_9HYPO|nr:hypothetical protein QQS21_010198 [Conoideocrella luteorostrata]